MLAIFLGGHTFSIVSRLSRNNKLIYWRIAIDSAE